MRERLNPRSRKRDIGQWLAIVILVSAGVFANYYFQDIAWSLRAIGWLLLLGAVLGLFSLTTAGYKVFGLGQAARLELRKVVWPSRQETVQVTLLVTAMVIVMAMILWGIDTVLLWVVNWFTGQRG